MQQVPKELFTAINKAAHFKVGIALYSLADKRGQVRTTTKELAAYAGVSPSTLTRAFRDLESKGFLATQRTRKGFNKFSFNVYTVTIAEQLSSPAISEIRGQIGEAWLNAGVQKEQTVEISDVLIAPNVSNGSSANDSFPSLKNEQSTADQAIQIVLSQKGSNKDSEILRISSSRGNSPEKNISKKVKEALLKPNPYKKLSVNPRDHSTRGRRPVESWTTWDVAAEFSYKLQKRFPMRPPLINMKKLEGALRGMRSRYNSNAKAELWLMELLFEDRSKMYLAETQPEKIIGIYLNYFKTDLERAIRISSEPPRDAYCYADDGKKFDNSMPGRIDRDEYNKALKGLPNNSYYFKMANSSS
jgi:DNA-binding transcriptional regulator YhcF (GntR family)